MPMNEELFNPADSFRRALTQAGGGRTSFQSRLSRLPELGRAGAVPLGAGAVLAGILTWLFWRSRRAEPKEIKNRRAA